MPAQLKTYWEIYQQMRATLQSRFPGALFVQRSLILTLAHAEALQIAEAYVQLGRLEETFSIDDAEGEDLARRVLDVGMARLQPDVSRGEVVLGDANFVAVVSGTLLAGVLVGSTTIPLNVGQGAAFAALSPLGDLILGRDTPQEEKITMSQVLGDTITLSTATTQPHSLGDTVYRSTVGSNRVIGQGQVVYVPGVLGSPDIEYLTTESTTLFDGDIVTGLVDVVSRLPGLGTVVSEGRIRALRNPPFQIATVRNPAPTFGGRDLETDDELRERYKLRIASLSRGTPVALEDAALNVESGGRRVVYARVVEPIGPGASRLYVEDGSGTLSPSYVAATSYETPIYDAVPGRSFGRLLQWPVAPNLANFHIDAERGVATSVGVLTLTDTSKFWVLNQWVPGYVMVDDQGGVWDITANSIDTLTLALIPGISPSSTPSLGGYAIVDITTNLVVFDTFQMPLVQPTATDDILMNYTNGEFRLNPLKYPFGMQEHGAIVITAYSSATGLIREVARVIHGDRIDRETYPGIRASGTIVSVEVPNIITLSFLISITADLGFTEAQLAVLGQDAVVRYVNSRGLQNNTVVLSEIIRRVKSIVGMRDVRIISPVSNPVLGENELPRTTAANVLFN